MGHPAHDPACTCPACEPAAESEEDSYEMSDPLPMIRWQRVSEAILRNLSPAERAIVAARRRGDF